MASEQPKLLVQVAAGVGGVVLASTLLQGLSRQREDRRFEERFLRAHAKAHEEASHEPHRHAVGGSAAAWLVFGGVVAGSALAAFVWRRRQVAKVAAHATRPAADEVRADWKAEHAAPEPLL